VKRGGGLSRRGGKGKANPPRPVEVVETPEELTGRMRRFWEAAHDQLVSVGGPGRWEAHHVVEKEYLKRMFPQVDRWDPRNALRVELRTHERHTNAVARIPARCLTDLNLEFAVETLGRGAPLYVRRHYDGYDASIELALAEATVRVQGDA
jgi:hypothetical protein